MAKLRVLHLADVHLGIEKYGRMDPATGLNSRLLDFTRCFDEVVDYAIENDVDLVIFAGDAYRNRDPNPTYQREFAKRVHRLARNGIQVFLLVGNHDLPLSLGRANTVEIFETLEIDNVVIGRKPGLHSINTKHGPIQIVALPWVARNILLRKDEYRNKTIDELNQLVGDYVAEWIAEFADRLDPGTPAILAAHLSVMGATYGSEKSVMLGHDVIVPKSVIANHAFDYVALGHVHRHQVVSNFPLTVYAGSIERVDFGEENEEKGFVVVDLEKGSAEYSFHPVKARRFLTIEVKAIGDDPTAQVLSAIEKQSLEDAVVRLFIETTPDKEPLINDGEIARALRTAYFVASISKQVERKTRRSLAGEFVEEMTPQQALERYLKSKDCPPARAKVLLDYGNRVINAGQQKLDM